MTDFKKIYDNDGEAIGSLLKALSHMAKPEDFSYMKTENGVLDKN